MKAGVHLVHKQVGESSFDVVRRFKHAAAEEGLKHYALGHGGTLDPFAEGLLLVLAGQATRLMELLHPLPKTYRAVLGWGLETDTCDHLGLAVAEGDASSLVPEALDEALLGFLGWRDQVPPLTCAKKIDGEAAYKKAHRGEVFELAPSRVYLHEAHWVSHVLPHHSDVVSGLSLDTTWGSTRGDAEGAKRPGGPPSFMSVLEITCRGGFYVRSLARDLGRLLGCGAHLARLARTRIGPWEDPGPEQAGLVAGSLLIPWCATRLLAAEEADRLLHGRPIPLGTVSAPVWPFPEGFPDPGAPVRALFEGQLVALLKEKEGAFWTSANLRGGL